MSKGKSNFLLKIWRKWTTPPAKPPTTNLPKCNWDGETMSRTIYHEEIDPECKKWLRLYIRTGTSRRSGRLHRLARSKVAHLFTPEQLEEHGIAFDMRLDQGGRDMWREIVGKHLRNNGIVIDLE